MSSFFGRLKATASPSTPSSGNIWAKDSDATPLEKLLADAGPIRADGSDKFFGFENFGNTCYCNSIVQCLYYSAPFREQVLSFPLRSGRNSLHIDSITALPQLNTDVDSLPNAPNSALSPTKSKSLLPNAIQSSPRKPSPSTVNTTPAGLKPEENKDSPEYKKKQAMALGPVLNMDYENSSSYGMPESLFTALKDIFEAILAHKSRFGVVSPNKFLEILRRDNEMFRTAMHQDAHEFLNLLLNQVVESVEEFSKQVREHSEVAKESGDSSNGHILTPLLDQSRRVANSSSSKSNTDWVHDLFEGTLTSETRCLTCENTSQRDEAFLDLSVDLDQHSSVTSCLRKFSEEEMLCERNKFHCDNCGGLQEAEKRMKIKRLPRILALHLKRFKYTEDLQRLQKLFHRVVYPYHLRLFNTTDDAEDPDRLYELYAVVIHIGGGPYHGHYVSIIKTKDRGWLLFDDELVEPVDKGFVRNFFGGENSLACAYVLFYQETTVEAVRREQEAEGLAATTNAHENSAEPTLSSLKQKDDGFNGLHIVHTVTTTAADDSEHFATLDHAVTAPPQSLSQSAEPLVLEATVTSPTFLGMGLRKADSRSKKEAAKEEKARKAAEKESEKLEKQKRKETEAAARELQKKRDGSFEAGQVAGSNSNAEDESVSSGAVEEAAHVKENGSGIMSGGLHRFKHGSVSLRQRSRFWSSKDKHERESNEKAEGVDGHETGNGADEKRDKPKSGRFTLGRKKSTFL